MGRTLGIVAAALVHVAILLFGGLLFLKSPEEAAKKVEVVDLLSEAEAEKDKDKDKKEEQKVEEEKAEEEQAEEAIETPDAMPDLRDLAKLDAAAAAPALDAVSLSAMADMLNSSGMPAGGDFYTPGSDMASGGRIGGMGKAVGDSVESIFSISDLDQKPRAIVQAPPTYPFELRRRKVEGSVSIFFVVDEEGRVVDPRVEKATDPAFERPALEAVRQWRFEPAVRGGQKVKARMRVPLRFSAS